MRNTETGRMAYHSEVKACPHRTSKSAKKGQTTTVKGSKNSLLQDKGSTLGSVKPVNQSCTNLDLEIIQNINGGHSVPSKTSAGSKKQGIWKKTKEAEELVKYMSNVPRYLQRTERAHSFQGKALNFGVLDWGNVRKWKPNQEQVPGRRKMQSPSSSYTSSSFSSFKSSTSSYKSDDSSFRKKQSAVNYLNHHRNLSSSNEFCTQILDEDSSDFGAASQCSRTLPENILVSKPQLYKKDQSLGSDRMDLKLKMGKAKASDLNVLSANRFGPLQDDTSPSDLKVCDVSASAEDKIKCQDSESKRRSDQLPETNQHIHRSSMHSVAEPSDQLGQQTASVARGRVSSQISQPSAVLHRKSRSLNFKESLGSESQLKPTFTTATSDSVDESGSLNSSHSDQAKPSTKARFSPLRRILDPIAKLKVLNHHNPVQELPTTRGAASPPKIQLSPSTAQPVKKNLKFSGWVSGFRSSLQDENRSVASTQHALLQILCKNGLPLFTFSFNNNGDVLAATMRKIFMPRKDTFEWMYTFHSVHGIKKSGGWLNQGRKDKGQGHQCNLIGQMNMFSSLCHNFARKESADRLMVTEFVLFGAEARHPASEVLEIVPNSELAAVVIEAPIEKGACFNVNNGDGLQNCKEKSVTDFANQVRETKYSCCSVENLDDWKKESEKISSVKVILPGGVHGLPATEAGKPSSLIERWTSGGSCDCGGWDVGCRLTVLSNHHRQYEESSSSTQYCSTLDDTLQVDLFTQGAREDRSHAFSLAAIKEGLYSVDFSESLSLLQAFSICVAILHNRKPAILSTVDNLHKETILQETDTDSEDNLKTVNKNQGEAHVSNVPYPPLSPAGRV